MVSGESLWTDSYILYFCCVSDTGQETTGMSVCMVYVPTMDRCQSQPQVTSLTTPLHVPSLPHLITRTQHNSLDRENRTNYHLGELPNLLHLVFKL